ncbi:MAG: type II 3-dehydroquinate dehydratase [Azospirillaceae bacterium]
MASDTTVLILNGPNLNMLGVREPEIYGRQTLGDIETACVDHAATLGVSVDFRQSNSEGELVTWVQEARTAHDGLIINAGGYSHTSVALLDALTAADLPVVEVHLSNLYRRESFRHHSYVSHAAHGVIAGFGAHGYLLALEAVARLIGPDA